MDEPSLPGWQRNFGRYAASGVTGFFIFVGSVTADRATAARPAEKNPAKREFNKPA
jgi:hypothetical protein